MPLTPEGWNLLKTWEGCRLSAYPDPASGGAPWTIGYGHTGAGVMPGLTITQQQAEAWLQSDAAEAAHTQFVAEKPVVVAAAEPEVELASQPIQLLNAVRHHRELHQLQRSLTAEQLSVFAAAFRAPVVAPAATRPTSVPFSDGLIQLTVCYLSQNDSSTGQGCRRCFASTCAMAAGAGVW